MTDATPANHREPFGGQVRRVAKQAQSPCFLDLSSRNEALRFFWSAGGERCTKDRGRIFRRKRLKRSGGRTWVCGKAGVLARVVKPENMARCAGKIRSNRFFEAVGASPTPH